MKRIRMNHLVLSLALVLVLIVACGPTPAPTEPPPPPPTEAPAPTEVPPTEAPPEPTAEPEPAAKEQLIIAYDSDIDHIENMQFRSLGGYDATANLYEPMIAQVLVPGDPGELIGTTDFEGAVAESFEVSEDGTVFTFNLREEALPRLCVALSRCLLVALASREEALPGLRVALSRC